MNKSYTPFRDFKAEEIILGLGTDHKGKPTIHMQYGTNAADVAVVTPACVTNWPRISGDGNFGTMWGPTDIMKAKFTIDLTDGHINSEPNVLFTTFSEMLEQIDDKLLDFVHNNQLKILGRKNLSREEVKMLQIRSVRPKYDKVSGILVGHTVQMSAQKFAWDGLGGKYARTINVCDMNGSVVPGGQVCPGDVVAATTFVNQVYTGVGGDKFGIHWSFEDVQVVCQRTRLAQKTEIRCFGAENYEFAAPYTTSEQQYDQSPADVSAQFSD